MTRIARLLRKDLLVLRRSPLLLAILVAYPLAIAVLVGLVASYGSSKPRVALVGSRMPIVFLGLIPGEVVPLAGWLSDLLPFTHAVRVFRSAHYDLSRWPELVRKTLWLLVLGGIFGVLSRAGARRLLA